MYQKDFETWHFVKKQLNDQNKSMFFNEREIWWCSLGVNIGYEEDGKHNTFERPILIIKKFNTNLLWIVPFTSQQKTGKLYYGVDYFGKRYFIILSQLRTISSKRLLRKMRRLDKSDFFIIRKRLQEFL